MEPGNFGARPIAINWAGLPGVLAELADVQMPAAPSLLGAGQIDEENRIKPFGRAELQRQRRDIVRLVDQEHIAFVVVQVRNSSTDVPRNAQSRTGAGMSVETKEGRKRRVSALLSIEESVAKDPPRPAADCCGPLPYPPKDCHRERKTPCEQPRGTPKTESIVRYKCAVLDY